MSLEQDRKPVENINMPISIGDTLVYLDDNGRFSRIVVGGVDLKIESLGEEDVSRTTIEFTGSYKVIVSLREDGSVTAIASKALDSKSTYHEIIVFDKEGKPVTQTITSETGELVHTNY